MRWLEYTKLFVELIKGIAWPAVVAGILWCFRHPILAQLSRVTEVGPTGPRRQQATYEINHVDGTLDYVCANLQRVREIIDRHSLPIVVNVRFIRFDYNAGEVDELRRYAEGMRYTFEVIEGDSHPTSSERCPDLVVGLVLHRAHRLRVRWSGGRVFQ
jgi:hypothetical protein